MPNPGNFAGRVLNENTNQGKEHGRGGGEKNSTNTPGFCKGLMSAKTIFWAGLKYEMGNGKEISFWGMAWLMKENSSIHYWHYSRLQDNQKAR